MPARYAAGMESESPIMPPKIKTYASAEELIAKLEGRAALWHRTARENEDRAVEFDGAVAQIRGGATTVTVGRTTYTVGEPSDTGSHA